MASVGFTGTRHGMNIVQRNEVRKWLRDWFATHGVDYVHHGDCVGADEGFHYISLGIGVGGVVVHPPTNESARAFVPAVEGKVEILPPKPFLDRNKDIVMQTNILLAAPRERVEPRPARGQGTWSTVRYGREMSMSGVVIFWPDGRVQYPG